jgi:hypothetical protein
LAKRVWKGVEKKCVLKKLVKIRLKEIDAGTLSYKS